MSISSISTMPVSCCAVNCTNRFIAGSGIGFYVFPVKRKKHSFVPFPEINGNLRRPIVFVDNISLHRVIITDPENRNKMADVNQPVIMYGIYEAKE